MAQPCITPTGIGLNILPMCKGRPSVVVGVQRGEASGIPTRTTRRRRDWGQVSPGSLLFTAFLPGMVHPKSCMPKNCGGCGCRRDDHLLEGVRSESGSTGDGSDVGNRDDGLDPKHKIFLSFSGAQRHFVEELKDKLVSGDRYPFYDRQRSCLPLGENAPKLMWEAIKQCRVGVVILSEEYFTRTKWPMLELVRMTRELKRKENPIKIIPVFLGISPDDCRDRTKHEQWSKIWEKWANIESNRVYNIDVGEWVESVQEFFDRPVQRLELRSEGQEGALREEIVDAIRKEVRPEFAFSCGDVQGRARLYEDFRKKIFREEEGENAKSKVRVVGLYGVGGGGKTTLCKVLHYELSPEFRDKVCYVDLRNMSREEVYRKVTRELVELEREGLDKLINLGDSGQFVRLLNSEKLGKRVFLAIDGVTDEPEKVDLVQQLMNVKWRDGSVVLVTSGSENLLNRIGIDRSQCFRMLDLEEGEARAVFLKSVNRVFNSNVKVDEVLLEQCLHRCYFSKGDGTTDRHWHPYALEVLGKQLMLACGYDPDCWKRKLDKIDTFNATDRRSDEHPIFSIFRFSFDALKDDAKLLFMDVALFKLRPKSSIVASSMRKVLLEAFSGLSLADFNHPVAFTFVGMMKVIEWETWFEMGVSVFEWLCMVHDKEGDELKDMLDSLKRKSVLEFVDDEYGGQAHDLWVEFAREETREGSIARMYETPLKPSMKGDNVRSMRLEVQEAEPPKSVDLNGFPMLSVLSVFGLRSDIKLNVSKLSLLKSLEVTSKIRGVDVKGLGVLGLQKWLDVRAIRTEGVDIEGLGALQSLAFLKIWGIGNSACLKEIKNLTNLEILDLDSFQGDVLPDLRKLTKLRVLKLRGSENLKIVELRNLPNLMVLDVGFGEQLRRLDLFECTSLKVLGLENNKVLQELRVSSCPKLDVLPGLDELNELTVLHISGCPITEHLPNIKELEKLEDLDIDGCKSMEDLLKKTL